MEDFEYFERWPTWLRWISFIPMLAIGYTVAYFLGLYVLWWTYGWMGLSETSLFGYIIISLHRNYICFFFGFVLSVSCVPKGRIIVQSIYLGLLIFLLGMSSTTLIKYGTVDGAPTWSNIFDFALNLLSGISVLWMAVYDHIESNKRNSLSQSL